MVKYAVILFFAMLTGCGGGGDDASHETQEVQTKPLLIQQN